MVELPMQPTPPKEEDYGFTVSLLRSTISKYFIVNDVRFDRQAYAFFVQVDERTLEGSFDDLRREMLDLGFVPNLLKERPGYVVYVVRMPERQFRGITVNVVLLILTIASTIGAGMMFVFTYEDIPFWSLETAWKGALYFAAPLMLILGLHEMGHYLAARKHKVAASLPFFIPAPPFPFIIGTFGAFISLREPIHSKRSLMDIGFSGPIAGFVVAIFVTILGFKLSAWDPHYVGEDASASILLGTPLIFDALARLVPPPADVLIHPTAFAGWVGFLVTFINLLPAGQLDGGHISRALFGQYARYVGFATVALMVGVSWWTGYWGWVLFVGFIILFLNHPPPLNDISPLTPSRYMAGVAAIIMLMVCFVPAPFTYAELQPDIDPAFEEPEVHVFPGELVNNTLVIVNTGNTKLTAQIRVQDVTGWGMEFQKRIKFPDGIRNWSEPFDVLKDRSTNFTTYVNLSVSPGPDLDLGDWRHFVVEIKYVSPPPSQATGKEDTRFRATVGWINPRHVPEDSTIPVDWVENFEVRFTNAVMRPDNRTTRFDLALNVEGGLRYTLTDSTVENMTSEEVNTTPPMAYIDLLNNGTARLMIWVYAPPGTPETTGLRVNLTVAVSGMPGTATLLGFGLDVGTEIYDVSISSPNEQWSFTPGTEKNITFALTSHSNVDTLVTINYSLTGPDGFEILEVPETPRILHPDDSEILTFVVFANGDVDDEVTLRVTIEFGVMQGSFAATSLVIVSG